MPECCKGNSYFVAYLYDMHSATLFQRLRLTTMKVSKMDRTQIYPFYFDLLCNMDMC